MTTFLSLDNNILTLLKQTIQNNNTISISLTWFPNLPCKCIFFLSWQKHVFPVIICRHHLPIFAKKTNKNKKCCQIPCKFPLSRTKTYFFTSTHSIPYSLYENIYISLLKKKTSVFFTGSPFQTNAFCCAKFPENIRQTGKFFQKQKKFLFANSCFFPFASKSADTQ